MRKNHNKMITTKQRAKQGMEKLAEGPRMNLTSALNGKEH